MNENLDLTKILDGCPKGTKFYSSVYGELKYSSMYVNSSASEIFFEDDGQRCVVDDSPVIISYRRGGNLFPTKGECTIFPSKDQRDWNKFVRFWDKKSLDKPVTEKFDPKTLHPWDKILVRKVHSPFNISPWSCEYFSYINPNTPHLVNGIASRYEICIPYNDETKHLRGTTDDCPEYYKWWEE